MRHSPIFRIRLARVCLALCLLCFYSFSVLNANISQQEAENKLSKVQTKIQASQRKIEKRRGEVGNLEKQLRESEKQIGYLDQQVSAIEKQVQTSNKNLQSLDKRNKALQKKLMKHQNILYAQVRSEYLTGGQQKLKLLLNQQEPTKIGRTLVYYDYLHRARLHKMEDITNILQEAKAVQAKIQAEHAQISAHQASLMQEKKLLQDVHKKRNDVLRSLEYKISSEQARLDKYKEDEKQLQELLDRLQSVLANMPVDIDGKEIQEFKGKLYWPVVGKPINKFGEKRNSARSDMTWEGIYIPSKKGNNVRSIFRGRVVFAEWMRGLGLLIIVDHGGSYMSLYGHNQSLFKNVGEWVDSGERIATVGQSGGNVGAGLYFEIRKQGKPINPATWCTKQASASRLAN